MKLTLERQTLLEGLNKVNKAIDTRTPLEALSGIKIDLNEKGLELLASDSDLTIKTIIPQEKLSVKEMGTVLLDAKILVNAVKNVKSEKVTLDEKDTHVLLKAGKSKFKLVKMDVSSYPRIDLTINPNDINFELNAKVLKRCIEHTAYATSNQETKPILTGLNFKGEKGVLATTGCDSYRFGKMYVPFKSNDECSFDFTLPTKTVNETSKLLTNEDDDIQLSAAQRGLIIRTKDLLIKTRLIDGNYPDINRLTPPLENSLFTLKLNVKELLAKLINNTIVADLSKPTTTLRIYKVDGEVKFELSSHSEIGDSIEELDVIEYKKNEKFNDDEEYLLAFNNQYLQETLKRIEEDEVTIYFNGVTNPFIVKPKVDEDKADNELHLLLPYRVR